MSDDLGKLASNAVHQLYESPSFEEFIWACQGPSDLQPMVGHLPHSAASHLDQYRRCGILFNTMAPYWTTEQKLLAVKRSAHMSASDCAEFVCEALVDLVHKQFWVVLPVDEVLELEELRLSPLGAVPQHKQQPRVICDYTYCGVNQDTEPTAPPKAMQFGHAPPRILFQLANSDPAYGPVCGKL